MSSSNSFPAGAESYRGVSNQEIYPFSMGPKSRPIVIKPTTAGMPIDRQAFRRSDGVPDRSFATVRKSSRISAGESLDMLPICPISIEFCGLELKSRAYPLNRSESRL